VTDAARIDPARPPTLWERSLYRFVRFVAVGFCRTFWALSVSGAENVPKTGAFILAPVHRSNIDTVVVAAVTKRRLRYMGKDTMWKYRIPGAVFTALGSFPVHRGSADREALRLAQSVVEAGEPIVMFPEGTRQSGPDLAELFDGPAFIAARVGIPIVPVGIGGSERAMPKGAKMLRPVHVHLEVGAPIPPPARDANGRVPRRALRETTERLAKELQPLFDEARTRAGSGGA
jgi:1-acyl-sn-glycerol-3-phosphate acyltransferase